MSAGSFRGDAADSENNGEHGTCTGDRLCLSSTSLGRHRDSSTNRDVTDRRLRVSCNSIASVYHTEKRN